jgi:hypothetical protein
MAKQWIYIPWKTDNDLAQSASVLENHVTRGKGGSCDV